MMMWMMIMYVTLAVTALSLLYVSNRVCRFAFMKKLFAGSKLRSAMGILLVFGAFGVCGFVLNYMNAIVCIVYMAMIWLFCDLFFYVAEKYRAHKFDGYYSGGAAIILSIAALSFGWYMDHNVWKTEYLITTNKDINNLKVVMFADSHLGTTFGAEEFAKHINDMQKQNPDIVVVVGDFVDDSTSRDDMIAAAKALGSMQTKYGVYFVFGNHDKGYYGAARRGFSAAELVSELQKNGVVVLRDETMLLAEQFYLIGRRDFSEVKERGGERKSIAELTKDLDKSKYMLVLDHQPVTYDEDAAVGVDLVLSGHTHGGQLFPFNQVGKWIGANDLIYGHERRNKTDFIVTSGISDWAIKFKTGTKSEYVVLNLQTQKNGE